MKQDIVPFLLLLLWLHFCCLVVVTSFCTVLWNLSNNCNLSSLCSCVSFNVIVIHQLFPFLLMVHRHTFLICFCVLYLLQPFVDECSNHHLLYSCNHLAWKFPFWFHFSMYLIVLAFGSGINGNHLTKKFCLYFIACTCRIIKIKNLIYFSMKLA